MTTTMEVAMRPAEVLVRELSHPEAMRLKRLAKEVVPVVVARRSS